MAQLGLDRSLLSSLKDKVVVLTGGATGIGREAVKSFYENGAKILFGDVSTSAAEVLVSQINSSNVQFQKCNVASYSDQLDLFAKAEEKFGGVDIVIANAGVSVHHDPFAASADFTKEPTMIELDVNLKAVIFTARIGQAYLRKRGGGDIILVSSIAGFKEAPALVTYLASKHGVLGVVRGLHQNAIKEGIRVCAICPWMTRTGMVIGIEKGWDEQGLPANKPEDVARAMLICATANRGENGKTHPNAKLPFTGKIVYVAGGESYEIEDNIQELEPQWLGKENSEKLAQGQAFLLSPNASWAHAGSTGWEGK